MAMRISFVSLSLFSCSTVAFECPNKMRPHAAEKISVEWWWFSLCKLADITVHQQLKSAYANLC